MTYISQFEDPTWGSINEANAGIPPALRSQIFVMGSQGATLALNGGAFHVLGKLGGEYGYCIETIEMSNGVTMSMVCGHMREENDGCFHPSTRLLLANGTLKLAEDVRVGDVFAGRGGTGRIVVQQVIWGPEKNPLKQLRFGGSGELIVTAGHPLLTTTGFVRAGRLRAGDVLIDGDGNQLELDAVEDFGPYPGQQVINFVVSGGNDGDRTFIAEGVLSGDLTVQQSRLASDD